MAFKDTFIPRRHNELCDLRREEVLQTCEPLALDCSIAENAERIRHAIDFVLALSLSGSGALILPPAIASMLALSAVSRPMMLRPT